MNWTMRKRLEIGFGPGGMSQRADGTWKTDFILRVLDDEQVPATVAEAETFVRRELDGDSVLGAVVGAAVAGMTDPLQRAVAATRAVHGHAHLRAAAWRAKRNVSTNQQAVQHSDQVQV